MRIFVIADTHGDLETLGKALSFVKAEKPDLLLLAGDYAPLAPHSEEEFEQHTKDGIPDREALSKLILVNAARSYAKMEQMLDAVGVPALMVPGNHDISNYVDHFKDKDLHLKARTLGSVVPSAGSLEDLVIAGCGSVEDEDSFWLVPPYGLGIVHTERELYAFLEARQPDILLLHNPPLKTVDGEPVRAPDGRSVHWRWIGSLAARRHLAEHAGEGRPRLVVGGHLHAPNLITYAGAAVVNPGNLGRYGPVLRDGTVLAGDEPYGTFCEVRLSPSGEVTEVRRYTARGDAVSETARRELK